MSRVSKKKMIQQPSHEQIAHQLANMRSRLLVGQGSTIHNLTMDWAKTLPFKYGTQDKKKTNDDSDSEEDDDEEEQIRPSIVGEPYKIMCKTMAEFPPELKKMKMFCFLSKDIKEEDVNSVLITVIPPPRESSSYENTIDSATMMVKDRFIYYANSDEMVEYVMQSPDKLSEIFGASVPKNIMTEIPEHINRGYLYHFDQASAMSLSIKFNDLNSFQKASTNRGGSRKEMLKKAMKVRYIFVFDFLMKSADFKNRLKTTVEYIGGTANTDTTEKGKLAKKAMESMKKTLDESNERTGSNETLETFLSSDEVNSGKIEDRRVTDSTMKEFRNEINEEVPKLVPAPSCKTMAELEEKILSSKS